MNLTKEQVSNLCLLADFMEGLDDPKFTMQRFTHYCGAPACALGWACTVPALKAQGLDLLVIERGGQPAVDAAGRVFGGYSPLFSSDRTHDIQTPQQWAAYCRAFLKENGYDITKDPFKTFMNRALAPVDLEGTNV